MIDNWTIEQIENHVDGQLEFVGLARLNEKTKNERLLLFHLYVAAAMFFKLGMENLSWSTIRRYHKECKSTFNFKNFLAEIRKTKKKEKVPPTPPNKETKEGEITELPPSLRNNGRTAEQERKQNEFYAEVMQYKDKYGEDLCMAFYCRWAQIDKETGKLNFELCSSWSTNLRLLSWSRKSFAKDNTAAKLRLERSKAKGTAAPSLQNTPQQDAVAKKRAADNAQREAEIDKAKEEGVSFAEYQRQHPESTLGTKLAKVQATLGGSLHNPK